MVSRSSPSAKRVSPSGSLCRSASEPVMTSGSLRAAGAQSLEFPGSPTRYERLRAEGLFRERVPEITPAGHSLRQLVPDSVARDLQPEICYPLPQTPMLERRLRKLSMPLGETHVHYGLRDQRLPGENFPYGRASYKGATAEGVMKAGLVRGIAAHQREVSERIYETSKKEPLGKSFVRGHDLHMSPNGFGKKTQHCGDIKSLICHTGAPAETEEAHRMYRKTHKQYHPGERMTRSYEWPDEVGERNFEFGVRLGVPNSGERVRLALQENVADDGSVQRTRFVPKVSEAFRQVENPALYAVKPLKQNAGSRLPPEHVYGTPTPSGGGTAGGCIVGDYSVREQLPDADLGRCLKVGRRNVTNEHRAFGIPSLRGDKQAPERSKRALANMQAYGDEPTCAVLLSPQRFEGRGVGDEAFLLRLPKAEVQSLVEAGGSAFEDINFDEMWDEAVALFDDGIELASLDAFLYVYSSHIDSRCLRGLGGPLEGSMAVSGLGAIA